MSKQTCIQCNLEISNCNYKKHVNVCKGKLSWFLKNKHRMSVKTTIVDDNIDWKAVQDFYNDNHSTDDVCKHFNMNYARLNKATKAGKFVVRRRQDTAKLKYTTKRVVSEQTRNKISESMRKAVLEGRHKAPNPYGTKCTHYTHTSWIGNIEPLQGSWEKRVAQHLDTKKLTWHKVKTSFTYVWNGANHEYFPDFYVKELDVFVEVKGYQQDRDLAKWSQFPHKLIIVNKTNLNNLDAVL